MRRRQSMRSVLLGAIKKDGRPLRVLALAAGLDPGQLTRYIQGERDLVTHNFDALARVLRLHLVPEDQLKGDKRG